MTAGQLDFSIEIGARFTRTLNWKDGNGTLVPLTGYTARLLSTGSVINMTTANGRIALTNPGVITLSLPASVTTLLTPGTLKYQLELTPASGADYVVRLLQGTITIVDREV